MMQENNNKVKLGYELVETIKFNEFNTFINKHEWKKSKLYIAYLLISAILMTSTIYLIIFASSSVINGLILSAIGFVLSILLLPIHEAIHFLVFKALGAKDVRVILFIKKFYLLTVTNHFPIDSKSMSWVAPMPFIFITIVGVIPLLIVSPSWQIILCSSLLFHASFCSSDLKLLDYFLSSKHDLIMETDFEKEKTYIFRRTF